MGGIFFLGNIVLVVDLVYGKVIFVGNCVVCYNGGFNVINFSKILKMVDLEVNGKNFVVVIVV